jgi:hypothetical protein
MSSLKLSQKIVICGLILGSLGFFTAPKPTHAAIDAVRVIGGHLDFVSTIGTINDPKLTLIAKNTTASLALDTKTRIERLLRAKLKKLLLDQMVDQIIGWIQGEGKPRFVTDWAGFLQDAGSAAAGEFIQSSALGFLCDPIQAQIRVALSPVRRFGTSITCTLDQIVNNVQNFYDDFNNGGWLAYQTLWEPQNNVYGAFLITQEEQDRQIGRAQFNAESQAKAGNGFLGGQSCSENPANPNGADLDGDGKGGDIPSSCEITTPGRIVGDLASKAFTSNIDFLLTGEELDEYVTAISDALINRLIISGVDGIKNITQRGSGGSNKANACKNLTGGALEACQQYVNVIRSGFTGAKNDLKNQIDNALTPRLAAKTAMKDSLTLENSLIAYMDDYENGSYAFCVSTKLITARALATDLSGRINANQIIIDTLESAKTQVDGLTQDNWAGLDAIATNIAIPADVANAEQLRLTAEAEKTTLAADNQTTNSVDSIKREVQLCVGGI